ncbi:GNAT family N-acetyltransferase [Massilia solisilvae]|uniref:GNAT family N-acetyltransferase n=1 Tax=Massilia solisilvae TaxID=1811225 RepID=A0ABT2BDP7_9BURK|nr:GNAT family N-acetyltransferase [Massilia solisilvae]MCS0606654.1 GNAT family N-acetyltransferase [Massilia solisilvae]
MEKSYSTHGVDWTAVAALFAEVGWGERQPEQIRGAFEKSSHVIFVYEGADLVAFGRTMDDGRYYAMLVDVVVKPSCQGRGLGREIVDHLREQLAGYKFVTLTAAVGKDNFYLKLGWSRQKSAMIWPMSEQQRAAHALMDD